MKCQVCGWHDGPCQEKKRLSSFFYIYLRKSFLKSMTVPCFMRLQINNLVGSVMLVVSAEQEEYVFQLKKKIDKTRFFGPRYNKFLKGDRIRFQLDHPPPFVAIFPESDANVPKERVLEPHVFEGAARVVVFSGGLNLTAGQTARMNHCVLTRGLGLGAVFVHRLTHSDVKVNGLRISKEIVSVLNITKKGYAIVTMEEDGNQEHNKDATYYTCADGRVCLTAGWFQFAKDNNLAPGVDILMLFDKNNDDYLCIPLNVL